MPVGEVTVGSRRVALPKGWGEPGADLRASLGPEVDVHEFAAEQIGEGSVWRTVEAIVLSDLQMRREHFDAMPALRMISVDGTGFADQIDVAEARGRGVTVCNVRDYAADAVAEYTIGATIALLRRIPAACDATRRGCWMPDALVGSGLRGARLGVVGLGSIGARVAEYASAFGMEVLCATARPDRPRSPAPPVRFAPLTEVLSTADVVTLHLPLTERTRGMLGAAELALMRPGAMLVNTSRGALVDSSALQDALLSGALAGAVLDVTDPEPLPPRSLLLSMANVVVTPHIAAATQQARHIAVIECLEHVRKFLVGNPCCVVDLGGARP